MKSNRVEAFSDGVFAVAITLLVLELKAPGHPVLHGLAHLWPAYIAYISSFLTIGIMWLNHHTIFNHVVTVDRRLLTLNLLLLMIVALVPFPTAVIGETLGLHGFTGTDKKVAGVFYGIVMIANALSFSAVWGYLVSHPEMLDEKLPAHLVRRSVPRFSVGMVAYVVATLIALVQPLVALILFGLIATYYAFEHLPSPTGDDDEGPAQPPDGSG